jgi:hypothetical protein
MGRRKWRYTPYYCEENVWHLGQEPEFVNMLKKAVFISNDDRHCAFFHQSASRAPTIPVFWDYHALLISHDTGWKVWDLDTTLSFPITLNEYLDLTFNLESTNDALRPYFRIVDFEDFHNKFSSDRSHMLDAGGNWLAPPPIWPPILNIASSNLSDFIDMTKESFGQVLDMHHFRKQYGA